MAFPYVSSLQVDFDLTIGAQLKMTNYGSGTYTGTATKYLAVDSAGNVIEKDPPTTGVSWGTAGNPYIVLGSSSGDIQSSSALQFTGGDLTITGGSIRPNVSYNASLGEAAIPFLHLYTLTANFATNILITEASDGLVYKSLGTTSSIAHLFNTENTMSSGSLMTVRNAGSNRFSVDQDGNVNIPTGAEYRVNGVAIGGGSTTLAGLTDVTITSIADNELLQWNSSLGTWENVTLSEAGISAVGHSHANLTALSQGGITLSGTYDGTIARTISLGISSLAVTTLESSDQFAIYDISLGDHRRITIGDIVSYIDAPASLTDLSDVIVTTASLATGHVLYFNGTASAFVNATPADAGLAEVGHTHATLSAESQGGISMTSYDGSTARTIALGLSALPVGTLQTGDQFATYDISAADHTRVTIDNIVTYVENNMTVPTPTIGKADAGHTSTSTSETLILSDTDITNAIYEGNIGSRVIRVVITWYMAQIGGTTPSVVFRVKLGTTTLDSTNAVSSGSQHGRMVFEFGALSTTNSWINLNHSYGNSIDNSASMNNTSSVAHGTGSGIYVYHQISGNGSLTIKTCTIEMIG